MGINIYCSFRRQSKLAFPLISFGVRRGKTKIKKSGFAGFLIPTSIKDKSRLIVGTKIDGLGRLFFYISRS